jgi:hypothetical protein
MLLGQVRFLSLLTSMDADLPKNFTFFAANFKWAGLQFPGLINGSAFEKHAGVQKQAAGAGKYLNAIKSSAEQLFLSSLIVQLIVAVVIVGFHLLLNFIIKKKLKKVPNALAFPKFELGHLLAVYESITQACVIAMVVPCDVGVKAGAWIVFLVIHAYVAYICSKVIKTHYKIETVTKKFEGVNFKGVNFKGVNFKMVKLVKQGQIKFERDASESKGVIERHCIIPAKVMLYRLCRSKPEGANKGTWINEADADESEKVSAFMGGYSELFACYDGGNVLFFVWEAFFEKLLRIVILSSVPGMAQGILLTMLSCFSLLTYLYRNPQSERILNHQSLLGKFTEFYSFAAITAASGSGTLVAAAPVVLGFNQAAIYIMLLLGIYDSLAKLSGFLGLTQKCSALCCGAAAAAPGTQWEAIEKPPAKGVRCAKGVDALVKELANGKITFSKKELKDLGVTGLTYHSYIETADGKYFQPIKQSKGSKVYELAITAKETADAI